MLTGSLKLIWAIFQALFIGFVQTLGSDVWLRLDSTARAQRLTMIEDITRTIYSEGLLTANWTTSLMAQPIALSVSQAMETTTAYPQYNYIGIGCYRSPDWPWYLQGLQWRWALPLVPTFAFLLALWNLQAIHVWKDAKHILIMVLLGCASYAANAVGETYIHGSVGGVLGAFAVSFLGSIYARLWNGYAFTAMVPGILLLVPTGLTAVGGLAQNYGSNDDQFSSGLNTGLAMVQCKSLSFHSFLMGLMLSFSLVSIALTIGLCLAAAGFHVFLSVKGWISHKKEDMSEWLAI